MGYPLPPRFRMEHLVCLGERLIFCSYMYHYMTHEGVVYLCITDDVSVE
jgi:hypothetical protein